jgi:hypothetical protein
MPIHDWTRVDAGIFHDFHHEWISTIKRALNAGLLPPDHYALAEQIAGGLGPDVLTLQGPTDGAPPGAKVIAIRHASNHRVVAVVEIVSPGNKSNRHGLRAFVDQAVELLRAGIHLLIVDLFPPGPRDPQGIHKAIWDEFNDSDFALPAGRPLTAAAYVGGPCPETFVQPAAVGAPVPEMPLFLTPDVYVPVPLETTYQSAWEAVPSFWRNMLTAGAAP